MKLRILLLSLGYFFTGFLIAQPNRVIGSGGRSVTVGNIQLEYTVGEAITSTFTGSSVQLTQGFHQPKRTIIISANPTDVFSDPKTGSTSQASALSLSVYPNPTWSWSVIELSDDRSGTLQVFDLQGRLIRTTPVTGVRARIDLTDLAPGEYLLHFYSEQEEEQTARLIKL